MLSCIKFYFVLLKQLLCKLQFKIGKSKNLFIKRSQKEECPSKKLQKQSEMYRTTTLTGVVTTFQPSKDVKHRYQTFSNDSSGLWDRIEFSRRNSGTNPLDYNFLAAKSLFGLCTPKMKVGFLISRLPCLVSQDSQVESFGETTYVTVFGTISWYKDRGYWVPSFFYFFKAIVESLPFGRCWINPVNIYRDSVTLYLVRRHCERIKLFQCRFSSSTIRLKSDLLVSYRVQRRLQYILFTVLTVELTFEIITGLRMSFICLANQIAFFRATNTCRREFHYFLYILDR